MKKIYSIIYVSLIAVSITSCKKEFLDINPEQQADVSVVVIDLPITRAAVMGTYSTLQNAAYYGRSVVILPDLMADNMYISRRNSSRYTSYDQYITIPNDGTASGSWNIMYRTIVNSNIIISKGEQLSVPSSEQAEVSHLIGEAYTMRALAHFDLLRFYAAPYNSTANAAHIGVPVISNSGTDKENILNPKRNTVKEGYDLIVSDLKKAITLMPATPVGFAAANKGHISQFAAKALLARVYLYMEDWVNAEAMATDVISSNKFTLLSKTNYQAGSTNFRTQNNSEAIFEIVYNTTNNLGTDRLAAFLFQGQSYGDGLATDDLFNLYTATDVRKAFMARSSRSSAENPANVITKYITLQLLKKVLKLFVYQKFI